MTNETDGQQKRLLDNDTLKAMRDNPVIAQHYARDIGGVFCVPKSMIDPSVFERDFDDEYEAEVFEAEIHYDYEQIVDKTWSHQEDISLTRSELIEAGAIVSHLDGVIQVDEGIVHRLLEQKIEEAGIEASCFTEDDLDEHGFEEQSAYENDGTLNSEVYGFSDIIEKLKTPLKPVGPPVIEIKGVEYCVIVPNLELDNPLDFSDIKAA